MDDKLLALGKAVGAPVAKTTGNLIERLLGPWADERGQELADRVRLRRRLNLASVAAQAADIVGDQLIHPVPDRLLQPIIEGASKEDEQELQAKWAALLANSALGVDGISPAFPRILSDLDSLDAAILDHLFSTSPFLPTGNNATGTITLEALSGGFGVNIEDMLFHLSNLERLNLIASSESLAQTAIMSTNPQFVHFRISSFGAYFVRACRPPTRP